MSFTAPPSGRVLQLLLWQYTGICRCAANCKILLLLLTKVHIKCTDNFNIIMTARQLCRPPAILFYGSHFFFSPPDLQGRLVNRHQTLPHVRWWPRFMKFSQKFGWPLPSSLPKFGCPKTSKFRRDFAQLRDLIADIFGKQQDIVNRKTALQTTDTLAQVNLIRCSLVRKRRKIGPEFWFTQQAVIRLGIAAHLV